MLQTFSGSYCYICYGITNLSIKRQNKGEPVYICEQDRKKQYTRYNNSRPSSYVSSPQKAKQIGWSESWLEKAKASRERISLKFGL